MSQAMKKALGVLGGLALVGLNIAVVALYVLWQIADTAAINHMESASGMDVSQLLPNANVLWLAAQGSLMMLLLLDVVVIVSVAMLVKANRKPAPATPDRSLQSMTAR